MGVNQLSPPTALSISGVEQASTSVNVCSSNLSFCLSFILDPNLSPRLWIPCPSYLLNMPSSFCPHCHHYSPGYCNNIQTHIPVVTCLLPIHSLYVIGVKIWTRSCHPLIPFPAWNLQCLPIKFGIYTKSLSRFVRFYKTWILPISQISRVTLHQTHPTWL